MKLKDFERGLKENDFSIGDSFWINGFCFEVINNKKFERMNKLNRFCDCNKCKDEIIKYIIEKEKFECGDCGVYYWVKDRNNFNCLNCEEVGE